MNPAQPSPPKPPASAPDQGARTPKRRRRWLRWLAAIIVLLLLIVFFLPNIIALPAFRQRLMDTAFSRYGVKASAGDLSLSWFSRVRVRDFKVSADERGHTALSVSQGESSLSLLNSLWAPDLGKIKIEKPELAVEFDKEGDNLSRLLRALTGLSLGRRAAQLEISDASLVLRSQNSPQPWTVQNLNLTVNLIPATQNPSGVTVLQGQHVQLLHEMELTPEMGNDLLKFIAPPLSQAAKTSGRVSLDLDEFSWPLGKPTEAEVKGRLTLHSVEVAPGALLEVLASVLELKGAAAPVQIAKDDAVDFSMKDGRVSHDHLQFSLAGIQLNSHGSVGLDESLDWIVEIELPALEGADLSAFPLLNNLKSQHPALHFTGTLNDPHVKHEGIAAPAFRLFLDFLKRRLEKRQEQPPSRVLPGRR
jgi:hypothetical protein